VKYNFTLNVFVLWHHECIHHETLPKFAGKLNSILSGEGKLGHNDFHHLNFSCFNINYIMLNNKISYSVTSQALGQKLALPPNLKCNNMLADQYYYTFQGAVIDEYGPNLE
jgi:hypothetical protein